MTGNWKQLVRQRQVYEAPGIVTYITVCKEMPEMHKGDGLLTNWKRTGRVCRRLPFIAK